MAVLTEMWTYEQAIEYVARTMYEPCVVGNKDYHETSAKAALILHIYGFGNRELSDVHKDLNEMYEHLQTVRF